MKMSDRSVISALSFIIVALGVTFYPGSAAHAAEEDHGNPGKFIENFQKGLSGLSKYFWSPKAQIPAESNQPPAKDKKASAPLVKIPTAGKPDLKAKATKPAQIVQPNPAIIVKKPAGNLAQTIKPDNKAARVQASPKTAFESKAVIDHKKKLAASKSSGTKARKPILAATPALKQAKPALKASAKAKVKSAQKAKGPSLKALAQPQSQSQAIARAHNKIAKQPAGKMSSLVTPRPIVQNQSPSAKSPKPASAIAPVGKITKDKKPIGSMNTKAAQKPVASKSAKLSVRAKTPLIKKSTGLAIATAAAKTQKQQLVPNDKGTYIWVPNIGSQYSQRFGLTGIPAKQLHAKGDLNRVDGRWIFAPKKPGMSPSIYGLSSQIHSAGDAGVWVGGGRNWVYVFDKNRNYGSIIGGSKTKKSAASKPAKAVASLKAGSLKTPKPTTSGKADKLQTTQEAKKAAKPQKGIEVKKTAKKVTQGTSKSTGTGPQNKSAAKANANAKMARNGKWSRVNNRWVFVPKSQPGQIANAPIKGLAEQVAKAPVTGGWVQRNNRWVYVAPQQGKTGSRPRAATAPNKALGKVVKKAAKKVVGKPLAKTRTKTSGIAVVQKPLAKKLPQIGAKTGLAEGPEASEAQVTKNQKIWVRKNNRWVYVFATPATSAHSAAKKQLAPGAKGRRMARNNSRQHSAPKQGFLTPAGKKPIGEFMFFVPGSSPGTGSWFIAPLRLLEKAKKIQSPSSGARR